MDIDDDKYLKTLSPGPTTPSQIHLQQLEPVLIGGVDDMLDPIKEEIGEKIEIVSHPPDEKGSKSQDKANSFSR